MTQTTATTTQESTMHIPLAVLGIVLDTSTITQRDAMKTLTEAFLRHFYQEYGYVSMFLIAASDGTAFPVTVSSETFERQWKELPWGGKSDVTAGIVAMQKVMQEYTKSNVPTPNFRTLLLTDSLPVEWAAYKTALQAVGKAVIGIVGEGETQRETVSAYLEMIGYVDLATIILIEQDNDPVLGASRLFRSLN